MLLSTIQTSEKLGISVGQVKGLIKRGLLKDHNTNGVGKKKHYYKLDSKEVQEYKNNGKMPKARNPKANGIHPIMEMKQNQSPFGISSRLENIENKLDILISLLK